MSRHVIVAVDGGGTKTDVVLADAQGAELASVRTTGTNHEGIGIDRVVSTLGQAIDEVLAAAGATRDDVIVSVVGLAGIDWDSDTTAVGDALRRLGLGGSMLVVNDSEIALRAGCGQPWGIVSSVGTGTVTAGVNRSGTRVRTMAIGWGEPSGSWSMVAASLDAIAAAHHGTGPATVLETVFLEALGFDSVPAMFEAVTRGRVRIGAGNAPLLDRAVDLGDEVAIAALTKVAGQHADMVGAVARRLGMADDEFELVMAGGVHQANRRFGDLFCARVAQLCPRARPALLDVPPVRGAVRLALDVLATDRGGAR